MLKLIITSLLGLLTFGSVVYYLGFEQNIAMYIHASLIISFTYLFDNEYIRKKIWGIPIIVGGLTLALSPNVDTAYISIMFILISISYTLILRKVTLLKNVLVAIFWVIGLFIYPFFYQNKELVLSHTTLILMGLSFIMTLIANTNDDICDIEQDKASGALTVPVLIGPLLTYVAQIIIHALGFILIFLLPESLQTPISTLWIIYAVFITFLVRIDSTRIREILIDLDLVLFSIGVILCKPII